MRKIEIERKFLVERESLNGLDIDKCHKKRFVQGYISTKPTIRLRDEGGEFVLCVKVGDGLANEEFEVILDRSQFDNLWKKVETNAVTKDRYFIPIGNGLTAELDIYFGVLEGLITVEVEFESERAAMEFAAPKWFGKDVSFDSRYKNTSLSIYGKPRD